MVIPQGPRVRASHLKEDLRALAVLGPEVAERIRARLRPETVRAIEEATRVDQLPVTLNAELAQATFAEAGEAGVRRWALQSLLESLRGFYRPLVQLIGAVTDPTPTTVARYFPRGWLATYGGCGEFTVEEPSPGRTRMVLRGVPPELRARPYLLALCGTFAAAWELTRYSGEVRLERGGPDEEEAAWLLEWRRR
jgi:hypothetical protein